MQKPEITKLPLEERRTTFKEVSQGFTKEDAVAESMRCLQCKTAPCSAGCPAGIDVKEFIRCIRARDFDAAIAKIKEANSLPCVCGRVCPQEEQCQAACVLQKQHIPIQIGYLERFVADYQLQKPDYPPAVAARKKLQADKVAVIGSGPAGLTCAADLARAGLDVHLFEALHKTGGVLVYGIPEFRLPKAIVEKESAYIQSLGVIVHTDYVAGRTITIDQMRQQGCKAFFIAAGAGLPQFLNIPGENYNGVYSANEFLTRVNLMRGYDFPAFDTPVAVGARVGVFGAGNVAFDCARCALRLGAREVHMIYRRRREEMPARQEEIHNAQEEGIIFDLLVSPLEIIADDKKNVKGVRCIKNELGALDSSGRRAPVAIAGSEFSIDIDTAIVAVGTRANPLLISTIPGLALTKRGYIQVNEQFQTSIPDIFASGDIVSGSATVISAIQQARVAARAMQQFLSHL